MKTIITDFNVQLNGHHLGFVQNILNYLLENPDENRYIFLLNPLPPNTIEPFFSTKVQLIYISEPAYQGFENEKKLFSRAKKEWGFICEFAQKNEVERVVLMALDMYQVAIGSKKVPFQISGIWFQPFSRIMPVINSTFKEKMRVYLWKNQKKIVMWWCCRNMNFQDIYILNDVQTVGKMNQMFGERFRVLPDPIFSYPIKENFDIRKVYHVDNQEVRRTIFLLFGAIDARKNPVNILKSFQNLSVEEAQKACLMFVGKVIDSYKNELDITLKETKFKQPNLLIINENRFVADDEMEAFFAQSDVILRMDVNFFASSGIVGIAAKHNKPLIVSEGGLVGEQVKEYNLGILENPYNLDGITEALRFYLKSSGNCQINGEEFYKKHDANTFVKTLLNL